MRLSLALVGVPLILGTALAQDQPSAAPGTPRPNGSSTTAPEQTYVPNNRGVTPPHAIDAPDPKYPKSARKDHYFGTVVLLLTVGTDGSPRDIRLARSVRADLDQAAIDAVKKWKFDPATKDGKPVSVAINVEVHFHPH